jgi:hypothetical protein
LSAPRSLASGVLKNVFPIGELRETALGEICPTARERFPFYFKLPWHDPVKLLQWRIYVRKRCVHDLAFRKAIWKMCALDVAFFAVTFAVIFEPRPLPRWLPFHLWTDQVSLLSWFTEIFGERSGAVNKTRGIGLSWLSALFIFHKWVFFPEVKIAVLTKDKDLLDSPDANSLIGKFQYLFDNLPLWAKFTPAGGNLLYRVGEKHTFINVGNGAVIQGYVSTSTKLRQLRFTMIFADEFAFYDRTDQEEWVVSAGGCTNCMLMVSTWNDFDDMFHYLMFEEESAMLKMNAFWWNNYERWQGAYKIENGIVTVIDKDYKFPPNYTFGHPELLEDGMLRSPWVDAELAQPGKSRNPSKAIRDIYGMGGARTNSFFSNELIQAVKTTVCEPIKQGQLDVSKGKVQIAPTLKSNIRLWHPVDEVYRGPYVAFADLAYGVGAAHGVLQVLDCTGEHVLEYGCNDYGGLPAFTYNCVLICRWLAATGKQGDGAVLLDFEAAGNPKEFVAEALRLNYGNLHVSSYKYEAGGNTRKNKKVLAPGEINDGYYGTSNRDAGRNNFSTLQNAILLIETRVKSQRVLDDMLVTGKDEEKNGQPKLPQGRKEGHGDYLYAFAGAWWRCRTVVSPENLIESDGNILYNGDRWDATPERQSWSAAWS